MVTYCTILHCIVLYYTRLCKPIHGYTVLYSIILYYTIFKCIFQYLCVMTCYTIRCYFILYCTLLYCLILYCTVLNYTVLCYLILYYFILYIALYHTILYPGRPLRPPGPEGARCLGRGRAPRGGSRGQRPPGNLNHAINIKISILGVVYRDP